MKYHINIPDGSIIASFENEYDRNVCIDALREEHPDCGDEYFDAVNEEKSE